LTVTDASGKVLRTLVDTSAPGGPAVTAGLNRYNWDLAVEDRAPGSPKPAARGPKAVPGTYHFHLTVGSATQTVSFKLLGDPRAKVTQLAYQAQYDLLTKIQAAEADIQKAGADIQRRRAGLPAGDPEVTQLMAIQASLGAGPGGGRGGRGTAATADASGGAPAGSAPPAGGRRGAGSGPPPLLGEFTGLYTFVAVSEDRPTGAALDRYRTLRKRLDEELAKLPKQ